ncbi:MAG: hypothetical protein IPM92_04245 [Saprospiraceae bacterium]|nr:hypothetical protein [Saprospiraceae bacterium]
MFADCKWVFFGKYVKWALTLLVASWMACDNNALDERDAYVGKYSGIKVVTAWGGHGIPEFSYDTSIVKVFLLKAKQDSIVSLFFDSIVLENAYLFKLENSTFSSIKIGHRPKLVSHDDSLYYYYQPGLGPAWIECFVKKDL